MPRPPARLRRKPQPQPSSPKRRIPDPAVVRKELATKLSNKPVVKNLPDSDDSDKLVVKGAGGRRGQFIPVQPIFASGALGNGDDPGLHPTRAQRKKQLAEASQADLQQHGSSPMDNARSSTKDQSHQIKKAKNPTTSIPSATKPSQTNLPSTNPSPMRETSILEGIRPRKRQHSILHAPELENSTLSLEDSFALPDDESTPLNFNKTNVTAKTPLSSALSDSALRKRKRGSDKPIQSSGKERSAETPTAEPTLPAQPQSISALRNSGQKHRRKTLDQDEEDIMAPPMSSSSSSSPQKVKTPAPTRPKRSKDKPPLLMTTEQLQTLMPSKRQKKTEQKRDRHFDIPSDSLSDAAQISEDESFLPTKQRKGKKPKQNATGGSSRRKAATKNSKQSTRRTTTTTTSTRSRKSAKNPSQQHPSRSITLSESPNKAAPSGGSLHRQSRKTAGGPEGGKENDKLDESIQVARSDDDNGVEKPVTKKLTELPNPSASRSYWQEVDDWSMDFEEVDNYDRSSEKDAR